MGSKEGNNSWLVWAVIFIAVIALGFLSFSVYTEFSKNKQVKSEIEILKKQAEKIKQENMNLEERIAYLGSQDYQKIQAKGKLNLQDSGENAVAITQDQSVLNSENDQLEIENENKNYSNKEESPNFLKWWNYFIN